MTKDVNATDKSFAHEKGCVGFWPAGARHNLVFVRALTSSGSASYYVPVVRQALALYVICESGGGMKL